MRVYFHEVGLLEELRYRLHHPAALLIVLPNGLVKLINALPFICGDLRRQIAGRGLGELPARVAGPARRRLRRRPRARSGQHADAAPMGPPLTAPTRRGGTPRRRCRRLLRVVVDGPLPLLPVRGAAAVPARRGVGVRDRRHASTRAMFWSGLAGVVLSVIGVEAFNEYFDARMGTDRVFNPDDLPPMSDGVFWCGVVGVRRRARGRRVPHAARRLADPRVRARWAALAAIFYEAPPIRWSYRGLGETVIALSLRPVDGARQPLPAHARAVVGRACGVAGARACSSWRSRSSTRFPTSTRTAWSASATSSCGSAAGAASWLYLGSGRGGARGRAAGVARGHVSRRRASRRCSPLPLLVASARRALRHVRRRRASSCPRCAASSRATSSRSTLFSARRAAARGC